MWAGKADTVTFLPHEIMMSGCVLRVCFRVLHDSSSEDQALPPSTPQSCRRRRREAEWGKEARPVSTEAALTEGTATQTHEVPRFIHL